MCVAGHFPLGDEDAERRAADAWSDKAEWCRSQAEYHEAKAKPPEGSHGDTVAAIADKHRRTTERFRQLATNCDSLARQLYESANATELQKMVIISMAVILAIQLARCALMFAFGGPIQAAIAQMATRTAAQRAWMRFVAFLSGRGAELAAERGSMVLLRNGVVMGVALGGGTQAGAQAIQVAKGDREQMDWTSVGVATAAGAVGGLFGMPVRTLGRPEGSHHRRERRQHRGAGGPAARRHHHGRRRSRSRRRSRRHRRLACAVGPAVQPQGLHRGPDPRYG
jgi:hypothetical protein